MGDSEQKAWQQFEELVENIHRKFHQGATVTRDDHIVGKDSGIRRQIDVSVRYRLGPYDLLIVVECKQHTRKVDVKEVEAFVQKLRDVGGHKGIMVAAKGFTNGAENVAKRNGIQTFKLRDARQGDWTEDWAFKFFIETTKLTVRGWGAVYEDGSAIEWPEGEQVRLIDAQTGEETTFDDFIRKVWRREDERDGDFNYEYLCGTAKDDPNAKKVRFGLSFHAETKRFTREASLELLGLSDANDVTHTDAFRLVTQPGKEATFFTKEAFMKDAKWRFGVVIKTAYVVFPNETKQKRIAQHKIIESLPKLHIEVGAKSGETPITFNFGDTVKA